LDFKAGETVGITGSSGSGKSSLLMIMGGLERASSGAVKALESDLSNMGIVCQSFHLIPTMTAVENVATPLELTGIKNAMDQARSELGAVSLGDRVDHYPAQLSGGEQQRVALARAAVMRPDILLADEPTGNLDGPNGRAIMDILFGLREKYGSTLILVTHDSVLANRCDRVIKLADGRLLSEQEAAE
jgi:putative ABC transport system ATP-binding protein